MCILREPSTLSINQSRLLCQRPNFYHSPCSLPALEGYIHFSCHLNIVATSKLRSSHMVHHAQDRLFASIRADLNSGQFCRYFSTMMSSGLACEAGLQIQRDRGVVRIWSFPTGLSTAAKRMNISPRHSSSSPPLPNSMKQRPQGGKATEDNNKMSLSAGCR